LLVRASPDRHLSIAENKKMTGTIERYSGDGTDLDGSSQKCSLTAWISCLSSWNGFAMPEFQVNLGLSSEKASVPL
jgi:hypothetical protein